MPNDYIFQLDRAELKEYRKSVKSQIRQAKKNLKNLNGDKSTFTFQAIQNLKVLLKGVEEEILWRG